MIEFEDVPVCHVILEGGDCAEEMEPGGQSVPAAHD